MPLVKRNEYARVRLIHAAIASTLNMSSNRMSHCR